MFEPYTILLYPEYSDGRQLPVNDELLPLDSVPDNSAYKSIIITVVLGRKQGGREKM